MLSCKKVLVIIIAAVFTLSSCMEQRILIGNAKQNIVQLRAFTITPTPLVNFEPPLSIATRLRSPAKIIAFLHLQTIVYQCSFAVEKQNLHVVFLKE